MREWLINLLLSIPSILLALSVHECAHAWMAYKLGDPTAKNRGRMTLNPLKHLDPWGVICMVFAGFGWAHPVPVDVRNLKKPKRDKALISLAGPVSNIILAFIGVLVLRIVALVCTPLIPSLLFADPNSFGYIAFQMLFSFLMLFCHLNAGLAVFNLLPIPPLDGSHLLALILPPRFYASRIYDLYLDYERYITFGFMLLIVFGALDTPLYYLRGYLLTGLEWIVGLIPFL